MPHGFPASSSVYLKAILHPTTRMFFSIFWSVLFCLLAFHVLFILSRTVVSTSFFFLRFYLFIFRERGREGERGEEYLCGCLSCAPYWRPDPQPRQCALPGNQTGDPLVHRLVLNPLSHTSQGWFQLFKNFITIIEYYNSFRTMVLKIPPSNPFMPFILIKLLM